VPWFRSARGRGHRDRSRQRSNPQLEPTLPNVQHQHQGRESHGCEEEEKENEEDVMTETRASYWGRAVRSSHFAGSLRSRQAAERCSAAFVLTGNGLFKPILRRNARTCLTQKHKRRLARLARGLLGPRGESSKAPSAHAHRRHAQQRQCHGPKRRTSCRCGPRVGDSFRRPAA
jgi:hypothetical protein